MSTPETVVLSYNELLLVPGGPVAPFNFKCGVADLDPSANGTLWLSTITDDPDTVVLLTALEIGDVIRVEKITPEAWGVFVALSLPIFSESDWVELTVAGIDESPGGLAEGTSQYVTVPTHATAPGPSGGSYATVEELARILLIPNPTEAQAAAMQRVLNASATEITAYLGLAEPLTEPYPDLVVEVNLERGAEHWKQEQSPFGIVVLGGELPPGNAGANAWRRHAKTLLPLKRSWGIG